MIFSIVLLITLIGHNTVFTRITCWTLLLISSNGVVYLDQLSVPGIVYLDQLMGAHHTHTYIITKFLKKL